MRDRFDEFRADSALQSLTPGNGALEMSVITMHHDSPIFDFMGDFFAQIAKLLGDLGSLRENTDAVHRCHYAILSAPVSDEQTRHKLELHMQTIKRTTREVREALKVQQQQVAENELSNLSLRAESRIRASQFTFLSHLLAEHMNSYNNIQLEYRAQCKDRIIRQLEIMDQAPKSDAQIEEMLEQPQLQIFSEQMLQETQLAKQTLASIKERHKDFLSLEQSIRELHEMFVDMAMLVESQGTMVENIERSVAKSSDFIEVAKQKTKAALIYQKAARRKLIIIILIVVIIIIILVVILVVVLLQYIPKPALTSGSSNSGSSNNNGSNNSNGQTTPSTNG